MRPAGFADWWKTTVGDWLAKIGGPALDHRYFWDAMHAVTLEQLEEISRTIAVRIVGLSGVDVSSVALDMTNFATFIASANGKAPVAQRGKAKQKRSDLRLVGLGLVVTRDGGIPLTWHAYPGDRPDVTQFPAMVDQLLGQYHAVTAAAGVPAAAADMTVVFDAGTENSDPAVAGEFLAAETAGDGDTGQAAGGPGGRSQPGSGPHAWYGDSAYGTGDLRGAITDAGHEAVIKPKPLRPAVEGGFTVDDFTVDEQAGTVTCPAGRTVTLSRTRIASFGVACHRCRLRQRCTTSKTGSKLVLHERDALLRDARASWASDTGLPEDYMTHRPNVERAVAQVATWRGRRLKLRYRGVTPNHAWLKRRTAAVNLRNLIGKGLARRNGAWILAT